MGVEQLLLGIPETASDHEAQEGLRLALGDPSLQLILWQAAHDRYVDIDGQPFRPPEASETRVATPIVSVEQGRLGLLVHDRALLEDRDALLTVAAVTRMALQRRRLRADLEARLVELERERDFIRDVVSAAPTYFIVIDLDGTIVRYNDALVAATGIPDDERVRGRRFEAVFVARAAQADVAGLIALQAPGPHEHGWVGQDDVELTVEWSLTPISDEHGENRLLMTGMDVSHRVQHELELERQRDFLRSISNATPSLLAVVHADGIVDWTGVNHAFCLATGFDDARSVGRYFWDLVIPPEQIGRFQAAFRASVDDSVETRYEMPWLSVDGGELIVEWFVTSLESYRPDHYLICGVDVTERRRQEDEVRRSRTRLVQAADAERRRLERNLHDGAQQRLISMALTLRLAESSLDDPAKVRALLGEASDELALALGELRELARGIHPAILSNRGLAPAVEALAERSIVPVEVSVGVTGRLPDPVEVALFYIVAEALTNVAKYAAATSARVEIRWDGDAVAAEVSDDGAGGADPARGSGLRGLADRVAALDGSLEIDSVAGRGTVVRAVIPLPAGARTALASGRL